MGQPLLLLIAFGFGFGPIYQKAGKGNYIQFLAPGIISMAILFTAVFSGLEIIWDRQFGFLKETLVAPVSRRAIVIGRVLGGGSVAIIQGLIVLIISLIIGFRPDNLLMLLVGFIFMALIAIFFAALGTAIASALEDMQGFQLIMNFLLMPLFFLSGALFPLNDLPPVIGAIVKINPLSYGVDGIRGALIGVTHFGLGVDLLVLGVATVVMVAAGSYLFSKIQV